MCCRDGGIGRRSGLKIRRAQKARGGSSPPLGTMTRRDPSASLRISPADSRSAFASLTPAERLNLKSAGLKKLVGVRVPLSAPLSLGMLYSLTERLLYLAITLCTLEWRVFLPVALLRILAFGEQILHTRQVPVGGTLR